MQAEILILQRFTKIEKTKENGPVLTTNQKVVGSNPAGRARKALSRAWQGFFVASMGRQSAKMKNALTKQALFDTIIMYLYTYAEAVRFPHKQKILRL